MSDYAPVPNKQYTNLPPPDANDASLREERPAFLVRPHYNPFPLHSDDPHVRYSVAPTNKRSQRLVPPRVVAPNIVKHKGKEMKNEKMKDEK